MTAPSILRGPAGPVAVLLVALTSPIQAQAPTVVFPASGTLPNYDRIPIGQVEGLESGAYVARTGDASSPWYNPAGLVLSEKSGLNASSNAYELNKVTLEGVGTAKGSTRFSPVGTYFGAVIGAPIIRSNRWRLGFGYTKSVSWTPGLLDGSLSFNSGGSTEIFGYSGSANFTVITPGVDAGFKVSDRIRVGAGISYALTSMLQSQGITDRLYSAAADTTAIRSVSLDASAQQLLFSAGAQFDVGSKVRIGALVVSPGARTGGSAKVLYSLTGFSTNGSADIAFRDTEARFEYRIPVRLVGGVSIDLGRFQLEGDVRYHGSTKSYDLLKSDVLATRILTDATGTPTVDSIPFTTVSEAAKSVVNVAVGGNCLIAKGIRVHAGFFTDGSPVDSSATSIFRSLDLYGGSFGISFTGNHLSGSLGAAGSFGTTENRLLGTSLGGRTQVTRLKVSTFTFMYAVSYKF